MHFLKGNYDSNDYRFLNRNYGDHKEVAQHFSRTESHPRILYRVKIPFRNEDKINTFSDEVKLNLLPEDLL